MTRSFVVSQIRTRQGGDDVEREEQSGDFRQGFIKVFHLNDGQILDANRIDWFCEKDVLTKHGIRSFPMKLVEVLECGRLQASAVDLKNVCVFA